VILVGDSRETLKGLADSSVDSCVCDPPYELGFMGKAWDSTGIAYDVGLWREVLRVLKPGGHLLAFGGTRTHHRMVCAIEDAGFEIRDEIQWLYGSGFPKSLDVSKAIDKAACAEREVVGKVAGMGKQNPKWNGTAQGRAENSFKSEYDATTPATVAAKQWQGWGTALKPACEPICVARKPLGGTVAANVLAHGTGAINVDGCRVDGTVTTNPLVRNVGGFGNNGMANQAEPPQSVTSQGRWPANVIHDGSEEVLAAFAVAGESKGAFAPVKKGHDGKSNGIYSDFAQKGDDGATFRGDTGSAARFFYSAKSSRLEREHFNNHATVKPLALMRYLVRLVTPPGGTVLDWCAGSGTTLVAAKQEGFAFIGCELDEAHADIIRRRLELELPFA